MRLGLKSRLHCRTCAGRSINVGMCKHVEVVKSMIVSDTNAAGAEEMDAMNMLPDGTIVMVTDSEDDESPMVIEDVNTEFRSVASRNLYPCKLDHDVLKRTMKEIRCAKCSHPNGTNDALFIVVDKYFTCKQCGEWMKVLPQSGGLNRPMKLHTLHHGCVRILVADNYCMCTNVLRYDGLTDGLVCTSRYHAFTKDLLDA